MRVSELRGGAPGPSASEAVEAWLQRGSAGVRLALIGASRDGPWLSSGPLDLGVRLNAADGIFRVGNAAGEAHPILGEPASRFAPVADTRFIDPPTREIDMTSTFDRLSAILMKDYKLQPDRLRLDAPLDSLGIDSLGTVELLWNIEDAFQIKLPSDPVELPTLGDVVRYVDELIARQGAVAAAAPVGNPAMRTT
jgi:acyl carrier protein